jgi:hypothetical protein
LPNGLSYRAPILHSTEIAGGIENK